MTNQFRCRFRQAVRLLLCKPILDIDIFSLGPTKLTQLLPERLHKGSATNSSAWIQETYAENLPCLLRRGPNPAESDWHNDSKSPRQFSILRHSSVQSYVEVSKIVGDSCCRYDNRSRRGCGLGAASREDFPHRFPGSKHCCW